MRWRFVLGSVVALTVVAACGGGDPQLVLPPRERTTTTTAAGRTTLPTTTLPGAPSGSAVTPAAAGPWEDATGNLVGTPSECGTLTLVSAQPGTDVVLAGIALHGLWSLGADGTWAQLPGATFQNRPAWIEWDPDDPDRFWEAGIYNGPGAFATTDGGATFRQLGDATHIDAVSVDVTDPQRQTMLAPKHEVPEAIRSTDGGSTWEDVSSGLPADFGQAYASLVLGPDTFLLGSRMGEATGIARSTDGGTTWTLVHSGEVTSQPLVLADGTILIALRDAVVSSSDQGATWTELSGTVGGTPSLVAVSDDEIAAVRGTQVYVSRDQGATWRPIGEALPVDATGLAYSEARGSFFAWRAECGEDGVPIPAGAIRSMTYPLG